MKDLLRCNKLMKYSAILVAFEELCSPNTYKKKKQKVCLLLLLLLCLVLGNCLAIPPLSQGLSGSCCVVLIFVCLSPLSSCWVPSRLNPPDCSRTGTIVAWASPTTVVSVGRTVLLLPQLRTAHDLRVGSRTQLRRSIYMSIYLPTPPTTQNPPWKATRPPPPPSFLLLHIYIYIYTHTHTDKHTRIR
jgi:hypothetical protein